jgi:predicted ABC-type ATPase
MRVAQSGVKAFAAHAMQAKVPFAIETVFSHWRVLDDGTVESKLDLIRDLQKAGYFVLLFFVGLANVELSILRVATRVAEHGHGVPREKLVERFPRTQQAIREAAKMADATIFTDNSRSEKQAFTVCLVQLAEETLFDVRLAGETVPRVILEWLEKVSP